MKYITVDGMRYGVLEGTILKDALINNGLISESVYVCKGKGICGRCSVGIMREHDKDYVGVKSCMTIVDSDMVVKIFRDEIILNTVAEDINSISNIGLAVDIGTTTLSLLFINMDSGEEVGKIVKNNPQYIYGADVVSRIDAYTSGEDLQSVIHSSIYEHIKRYKIRKMVISANTVMQHIFAGASLDGMRQFPMSADESVSQVVNRIAVKNSNENLFANVEELFVLPYVGPYFGADALLGIIEADRIHKSNKPYLFVDLGTNSEIALRIDNKILCTAAAAGCALLGTYRGSEIVEAVAGMLRNGAIDYSGRIAEGKGNATYRNVTLTQADIRSYQLMKAAIITGIRILLATAGLELNDIDKIYISGRFGESTDSSFMMDGGIIPNTSADIIIMGNSSLSGAVNYIKGKFNDTTIMQYMDNCLYYNMAEDKNFNDIFVDEINFNGFI